MVRRTTYLKKTGCALLLIVAVTGVSVIGAQEENAEEKRARLQTIQQQLKEQDAHYKRIEREEQNVAVELHKIEQILKKYQQQLQEYKQTFAKNERELKAIQSNLAQLQKNYNIKKATLAKRLRAIYKMGDLGYLTPLLAMSFHSDVQQQIKYLQIISERDVELINTAEKDMQAILEQKNALEKRKQQAERARKEIKEKQAQINLQRQQKDALLQRIQNNKRQVALVIERLEASSRKLEELLKKLEIAQKRPPRKSSQQESVKSITFPANTQKVVQSYGRHFRANKGKLVWPVEGKIITKFGQIRFDNTYTHYNGVDIQAQKGTPFYSVFKGTVKYADWFEGQGNLIIVDHGGNYYTVYAHADELAVKSGDIVEARQILGKVGDTDSIKGSLLYFEVRANGTPQDPQRWLAKVR